MINKENRSKKATVKDVAKAAGVSVATVSYVLNNKPGQKISEETRKKVLQMANLLRCTPSHEAISLATGKHNMIGITYHLREDSPSRNLEITYMVNLLVERFSRMKYNVVLLPYDRDSNKSPNRLLDGVIAIDLPEEDFKKMADQYYVPVICLDMIVNDFLFYQIYTDMPSLSQQALKLLGKNYYLIMDKYDNEKYQNYITGTVPNGKVIYFSDCTHKDLEKLRDKKVLVLGTYLALILRQYIPDENMAVISYNSTEHILADGVTTIENDVAKKANLTMNIMLNAFEQKFDVTHDYKI